VDVTETLKRGRRESLRIVNEMGHRTRSAQAERSLCAGASEDAPATALTASV
jgi:hypothetical protein